MLDGLHLEMGAYDATNMEQLVAVTCRGGQRTVVRITVAYNSEDRDYLNWRLANTVTYPWGGWFRLD